MKTLGEIAAYVGGRLYGDPSIPIKRVVHPSRAQNECDLALVLSPGLASLLASKAITNALVPEGIENCPTPNHILVARPRLALARVLELFGRPVHVAPGVDPSAVIDPRAKIGMMTAGVTTSDGNQIGARFENLITRFREETGRELQELSKRSLQDRESAGFIINHKQKKIRYLLKSPDPERDKQTKLFEFDRTSPKESLQAMSF